MAQQQADKYRRIYAARKQALEWAAAGDIPVDLNRCVKQLPTQADSRQLAYAHGGKSKPDKNHWVTPTPYIEAARTVMDRIDFDPFSSEEANEFVRANFFFTEDDDAFTTPWPPGAKTIWMNPPYGRGNVAKAVEAFLRHLPRCEQAIVLVNNATEVAWFNDLADACTAFVWTRGRIQFHSPESTDKAVSSNTRGQFFFYYGPEIHKFCDIFCDFGRCGVLR